MTHNTDGWPPPLPLRRVQCRSRRTTMTPTSGSWTTATSRSCSRCSRRSTVRCHHPGPPGSGCVALRGPAVASGSVHHACVCVFAVLLLPPNRPHRQNVFARADLPPLPSLPSLHYPHPHPPAAREKVVGWYSTGPKLKEADLAINELMTEYTENSVLVICEVEVRRRGWAARRCSNAAGDDEGRACYCDVCHGVCSRGSDAMPPCSRRAVPLAAVPAVPPAPPACVLRSAAQGDWAALHGLLRSGGGPRGEHSCAAATRMCMARRAQQLPGKRGWMWWGGASRLRGSLHRDSRGVLQWQPVVAGVVG